MMTIERSKLFSELAPGELEALAVQAEERLYGPGAEIFKEGESGDGIYLIGSGTVEISGFVAPNVRKVFSKIGAGDFFGEMAVLDSKPRSACAVAVTEATVYFIRQHEMLRLLGNSPGLALVLLREISQRTRDFNRQYVDEVLQAERLSIVGRFARSIVHDLKNPLNIISLSADMAAAAGATEVMRDRSNQLIRKQVERIKDLIGEILEFTQGGSSSHVFVKVNYQSFVEQILEESRPEAVLKSIALKTGVLPSVEIYADPKRLSRVYHNLLHNAVEAMGQGGTIFLRAWESGAEVVSEIEDTGPGIAPEISAKLFEPFATHGKTHGTGLGLSICRKIIEDHRGWIRTRSEPGHGAIFVFGLPQAQMLEGP